MRISQSTCAVIEKLKYIIYLSLCVFASFYNILSTAYMHIARMYSIIIVKLDDNPFIFVYVYSRDRDCQVWNKLQLLIFGHAFTFCAGQYFYLSSIVKKHYLQIYNNCNIYPCNEKLV